MELLDQNPDSTRSDPQRSCQPHFKYSVFSLTFLESKSFERLPFQTLGPPYKNNCDSYFDSSCSVNNVEDDHLGKLNELEDHSLNDPLEIDLNDLF